MCDRNVHFRKSHVTILYCNNMVQLPVTISADVTCLLTTSYILLNWDNFFDRLSKSNQVIRDMRNDQIISRVMDSRLISHSGWLMNEPLAVVFPEHLTRLITTIIPSRQPVAVFLTNDSTYCLIILAFSSVLSCDSSMTEKRN